MTAPKIKVGQAVTYISSKGDQKLAFITATPETVTEGTSLPQLAQGFLHLAVISPNGSVYGRKSVPSEDVAPEGQTTKVWRRIK